MTVRAMKGKTVDVYVIRRSDGKKWYIDDLSEAGTAQSNRPGKAKRFGSKWKAWAFVFTCHVPENWVPVKLVRR